MHRALQLLHAFEQRHQSFAFVRIEALERLFVDAAAKLGERMTILFAVGFAGESFKNIADYLIAASGVADPYMCLADFESYKSMHDHALSLYPNKKLWNRMSINNIAGAGEFAADRSIEEYAQRIWHLNKVKLGK